MDRNVVVRFRRRAIAGSFFLVVVTLSVLSAPVVARSANCTPAAASPSAIEALTDKDGKFSPRVGLNGYLGVKLDGKDPLDPSAYVLFLNGRAIAGLDDTIFNSDDHSLIFHLRRNNTNVAVWSALLGSPTNWSVDVSVSLGEKTQDCEPSHPNITGSNGKDPKFQLVVVSPYRLLFATIVIAIVGAVVWGTGTRSTILKDNLLPQIAPERQPYSLGRWQMAFWFTLIFASFIFLYTLLWDANTISDQALMLMGISGATGLAAIAVDAAKDTPVGAANNALRALGLFSYADVLSVRKEIADKRQQLVTNPPPVPARATQIQAEITDRQLLLRTYENAILPFVSQGWYRDLMTDINGTALHRLQVFCWTLVLGIVFLIGVYRDLAMPQFSTTLLALMAISGAGYVGFKYPEKQN